MDLMDVTDVMDLMDVTDVMDLMDVTDVMGVMDVTDVMGVMVVTVVIDVMDVMDVIDVTDVMGVYRALSSAARLCPNGMACPDNHFSFSIQSGAANVVAPKICLQNKMVLGTAVRNAGVGINVVILNGKTGELIKTGNFDMYAGDVNPLIELLKSIETGSVVMMASYDEPASKLTDEARKLIAELGSSKVQALGFRDNWVFVGGKGAAMDSGFEKYKKNDRASNKYEDWPEILELKGCIPRFME
uniref:ILEI/PANDER domain-containing protein n=1 Tax=Scophthalmus maximus TaxID=52904 RepID=A0A8D3B9S2_SCOMX